MSFIRRHYDYTINNLDLPCVFYTLDVLLNLNTYARLLWGVHNNGGFE